MVAVGPGTKDEPMELKVGDKVVFSKYGEILRSNTRVKSIPSCARAEILATVDGIIQGGV